MRLGPKSRIFARILENDQVLMLCLVLVLLLLYFPVLKQNPVLRYDDLALINPIKQVQTLANYLDLRSKNEILDLQPVRDLSYWLDCQAAKLGYPTFHLTNLALWFLILLIFQQAALVIFKNKITTWVMTFYLALHPVSINSVAWISARKHMLSAFFIAAVSLWLIRNRRNNNSSWSRLLFVGLFFGLSLLSQPINCLWPIWAFALVYFSPPSELRKNYLFWASLVGAAGVTVFLNQQYYYSEFFTSQFVSKYWLEGDTLALKLAAVGRYFFQLLIPIEPSISSYFPGEVINMIGLIMAPVYLWICVKCLGPRKVGIILLFIILPLSVVTIKMTSVFAIDTYLLTPLLGWGILSGLLLEYVYEHFAVVQKKYVLWGLGGFLLFGFAAVSLPQAHAWSRESLLYARAYEMEKTPFTLNIYGQELLVEEKYYEALEIGLQLYKWDIGRHLSTQLIGLSLLNIKSLSWENKYKILSENALDTDLYKYFKATFLVQMDKWSDAIFIYWDLLAHFSKPALESRQIPLAKLVEDIQFACGKTQLELCKQVPGKIQELQLQIKK